MRSDGSRCCRHALTRSDERIVLLHHTWAERNNNRVSFVGLPLRCDPTCRTSTRPSFGS
ncbi:hypothetical protein [Microbispora sp. CA-102843]|uniref:hypothetical protein n=1 Tax=Microbispora sp. CA-102843 TaxID=3239952 RepID=UPI003D8F5A7C